MIFIRLFGSVWNRICFFCRAIGAVAPFALSLRGSSTDARQLLYSLMASVSKYNFIDMNGMAWVTRHLDEMRASNRHSKSRKRNSCTPNWFNRFFMKSRLLVTNCQIIEICSGEKTLFVASMNSFSLICRDEKEVEFMRRQRSKVMPFTYTRFDGIYLKQNQCIHRILQCIFGDIQFAWNGTPFEFMETAPNEIVRKRMINYPMLSGSVFRFARCSHNPMIICKSRWHLKCTQHKRDG